MRFGQFVAETINMTEGLDDEEEEQFLQANVDLIPLCSVDMAFIATAYAAPGLQVGLALVGMRLRCSGVRPRLWMNLNQKMS